MSETSIETSAVRREAPPITTHDDLQREVESLKKTTLQLQRLTEAITGSGTLDELCRRLLEIALDGAGAALGVIRVRDGSSLRSRAAVGLDEEVTNGFTLPSATVFAGMETVGPG